MIVSYSAFNQPSSTVVFDETQHDELGEWADDAINGFKMREQIIKAIKKEIYVRLSAYQLALSSTHLCQLALSSLISDQVETVKV
jgi:hypothetical protein